jgi:predicted metalloprotease
MSGGGIPIGVGGGGLALLLTILFVVLTGNVPGGGGSGGGPLDAFPTVQATGTNPAEDPDATLADFSDRIFKDVDSTWAQIFQQAGREYHPARMVLFTRATESACGGASSAVGPHYCPPDQTVYLDLAFFKELRDRFGASGDFAHAYVIAHEVGHHVQNELGIMNRVENREDGIRLELQADCLAGVWGYTAEKRGLLDSGDTREALDAAAAVGDDRIQQQTQGRVTPENWTHGSSEQRMKWFTRGMNKGDPAACDTFSGEI